MSGILPITIGVSGHRDIPEEDISILKEKISLKILNIQKRYAQAEIRIATGLASGADQIMTEIGLDMGLAVIAALPMPYELYLDDFTANEKEKFINLYSRCTYHIVCSQKYEVARANYYANLADYLILNSQILFVLWDGNLDQPLKGGTADVVRRWLNRVINNKTVNYYSDPNTLDLVHFKTRRLKNIVQDIELISADEIGMISQDWLDKYGII